MEAFSTVRQMARTRRGASVDFSIRTLGFLVLIVIFSAVIIWGVWTITTGSTSSACDAVRGALGGLAGSLIDLGYFGC